MELLTNCTATKLSAATLGRAAVAVAAVAAAVVVEVLPCWVQGRLVQTLFL